MQTAIVPLPLNPLRGESRVQQTLIIRTFPDLFSAWLIYWTVNFRRQKMRLKRF